MCRYRGGAGIEEIDLYWSRGDGIAPVPVGDNTMTWRELVDPREETIYARVDRYALLHRVNRTTVCAL